jgi:glycosyltransferase involved in cell wall biosynthesis
LAEVVLAAPARPDSDTLRTAAAEGLLEALEGAPAEPVLLHLLGALLDELGDADAAEAAWSAALRLDPDVPGLRDGLRGLFAREAERPDWVLGAAHPLAARVAAVAAAAQPAEDQTLSLCMIVRDEEEMLPGCLEAIRPFVDEIVVVDTGSSDRTVAIAASFGARVVHFPWNGSFADARNVSLDAATGDWVMYLDADEHLVPEDGPMLRELLGRTWREGFELVETNFTGAPGSGQAVNHMALRIWRNRPEYRFEGRIHEQKTGRMPTYLGERFEATEIRVKHYGYLKSRVADKDKSRRNLELLEREAGEKPTAFTAFNLGSEYLLAGDPVRARRRLDEAWETVRRQPDWPELGYAPMLISRVAGARREAGDIAAAREAALEGLTAYPTFTDLVFELALCARAAGETAEAEAIATRCLELGDAPARLAPTVGCGTFLARCLLAEMAADSGRAAEAEAHYRRSLADHPDFVGPSLPLAKLLLARGARADELADAIPSEPPTAALLAATACIEAGNAAAAEHLFRAVLRRQPESIPAAVGLVEALLSERRFAEAAAEAAARAESPARTILAGHRLFAHAAANDATGLAAALAAANDAGVDAADLALYRSWGGVLAGADAAGPIPAEALPTAATALEALLRVQEFAAFEVLHGLYGRIAADPRERRERLAGIYLRRGFLDSAAEEWMAVVAETPDAAALVGLAQVALAQGWREDAALLGRQALELDPGNDAAERLVAAVEPAPVGA